MPARPLRLGVFGGTFDPPHSGHLIVARNAAEALELDRLMLVVSARPPHKSDESPTPAELRLEMLEAAVGDDPLLVASDLELQRPGPSYTVHTLQALRQGDPEAELFLLIGVDQWRELAGWREPERIGRLATVVVMARAGEDPTRVDPGLVVTCRPVPVTRIDLSATEARERVGQGRSIRHLVPEAVRRIIARESLYRPAAAVGASAATRPV